MYYLKLFALFLYGNPNIFIFTRIGHVILDFFSNSDTIYIQFSRSSDQYLNS